MKTTTYAPDGKLWPVHPIHTDTIKNNGVKLSIRDFLNRAHYDLALPAQFVDTRYKSQKVEILYGIQQKDKYHYTIYSTYDSLSRVTNYGITQCMVCNFLSYEYDIHYNQAGQIEEIAGTKNGFASHKKCKIYYDNKGNINRVECYDGEGPFTQVVLMQTGKIKKPA